MFRSPGAWPRPTRASRRYLRRVVVREPLPRDGLARVPRVLDGGLDALARVDAVDAFVELVEDLELALVEREAFVALAVEELQGPVQGFLRAAGLF